MKKLVLAALLTSFAFGAAAAEKISFGVSATYPPFESMDANNQIVGFDIDLAHALCKQMQAECTFTNHAFDSLIPALKFKKYDAVISGMDITPERSKQVAFTDPYYANSALVIAKKDAFHSFDDLKGKRIGMENGTTHQKYLQDKHPEVKTVAYDSYQNAIIDLKNGRIDGVFGDTAVVNEWLKTNPQLGAATPKVTDPQYFGTGLGIAVRPDNKALLEKLNAALKAIKADGTYQKISNQWFPELLFSPGGAALTRPPLFPVGRISAAPPGDFSKWHEEPEPRPAYRLHQSDIAPVQLQHSFHNQQP